MLLASKVTSSLSVGKSSIPAFEVAYLTTYGEPPTVTRPLSSAPDHDGAAKRLRDAARNARAAGATVTVAGSPSAWSPYFGRS